MITERLFNVCGELINAYVEDTGKPYKVLLIHGFGSYWQMFYRLIDIKDRDFDIAALDMPGCGKSSYNEKITLEHYANVVTEFIKMIGYENCLVISHSMGAVTALSLLNSKIAKYGILTSPFNYKTNLISLSWIKNYERQFKNIRTIKKEAKNSDRILPSKISLKELAIGFKDIFRNKMLFSFLIKEVLNKKYLDQSIKPLYKNTNNYLMIEGSVDNIVPLDSVIEVAAELNKKLIIFDNLTHFIWDEMTDEQLYKIEDLIDKINCDNQ